MSDEPLRLSRFVVFVDYGETFELQHGARGTRWRISPQLHDRLRSFAAFRPRETGLDEWIEAGVLVPPFSDTLAHHGPAANSEGALAADYQRWYWRHEIETEREYRWLGEVAVKMPSDLFYLQELLAGAPTRRVLELGRGHGGGAWYLASVLYLLGGGVLVSLDLDSDPSAIDVSRWAGVESHALVGDALRRESLDLARDVTSSFDLVIIDLGGPPQRNLAALELWAELVSEAGHIIIEDLWGHDEDNVLEELDRFMLAHSDFALCERASRHPLLKGVGLYKRRPTRASSDR